MYIHGKLVDQYGISHSINDTVSFPKLIKHAILAGLGPGFASPAMIASWVGLMLFSGTRFKLGGDYIQKIHPIYDPDEISIMSRLVGRSIADMYAKSHYGGNFTICYEHCCKWANLHPSGARPDFLSIDWYAKKVFSIEAKGFSKSSVSQADFNRHKLQSTSTHSLFGAGFGVASVTYDIYRSLKVRIEDPPVEQSQFNPELIRKLVESYYREINKRLQDFLVHGRLLRDTPVSTDSHYCFEVGALINPLEPYPIFMFVPREMPSQSAEQSAEIDSEELYVDRDRIGVWVVPNSSFRPNPLRG